MRYDVSLSGDDLSDLELQVGGGSRRADDVYADLEMSDAFSQLAVVSLVDPIFWALNARQWRTVMIAHSPGFGTDICAAWKDTFPPTFSGVPEPISWSHNFSAADCTADIAESLEQVADDLTARLKGFSTDVNVRADRVAIEDCAASVTKLRGVVEVLGGGGWIRSHPMRENSGWTALAMLTVAMIAFIVKDITKCEFICRLCVDAIAPTKDLARAFLSNAVRNRGSLLPRKTSAYDALQLMDTAYCLTFRTWVKDNAARVFTFWMADSSKRKSFDFLNCGYWYVLQRRAFAVFEAVKCLAANPGGPRTAQMMRLLLDELQWHCQIPTVLAQGLTKLEHKMARIVHGTYADAGDVGLVFLLYMGACSWTTDQGTETSINNFRIASLRTLIEWAVPDFEDDIFRLGLGTSLHALPYVLGSWGSKAHAISTAHEIPSTLIRLLQSATSFLPNLRPGPSGPALSNCKEYTLNFSLLSPSPQRPQYRRE
jgi:hypothetical protein